MARLQGTIALFQLENAAESSGLTGIGFGLALRRLNRREFVMILEETEHDESYSAIMRTGIAAGWSWIDHHESLLSCCSKNYIHEEDFDDDIPF